MTANYLTDPLINQTGADIDIKNRAIDDAPQAAYWNVDEASVNSFVMRAASPNLVQIKTTGVAANNSDANALNTADSGAMKFTPCRYFIAQIPIKLDSGADVIYGVSCGATIGLSMHAGVPSYNYYNNQTAAIPSPSGVDYCARLSVDFANDTATLSIANMTESLNPSALFTDVLTTTPAALSASQDALFPILFANNVSAANGDGGFYNPRYSDGSYPFQMFCFAFDSYPPPPDFIFTPYGQGYTGRAKCDFTINYAYLITVPNWINDTLVQFDTLEIDNTNNSSPVNFTYSGRQTVVPAGATVTLNLNKYIYPQFFITSGGTHCNLTLYAGTIVTYQSFR